MQQLLLPVAAPQLHVAAQLPAATELALLLQHYACFAALLLLLLLLLPDRSKPHTRTVFNILLRVLAKYT
jgi:hypothetical protein